VDALSPDGRRSRPGYPGRQRAAQPFLILAGLLLALTQGCSRPAHPSFQGYIEADYLHVAAPVAGILLERPVQRGNSVAKGTPLFTLESAAEQAALAEAKGRLAQSQARLDNLRKGRRPSEIAALSARLAQARATRDLADLDFVRREQLQRQEALSTAELDQARSRRDADHALVAALEAELETARLGARDDEVRAAEQDVISSEATVRRALWSVEQKSQTSTVDAQVQDTLFEPGEFVPLGMPVVSLLPPDKVEVRFYVPQAELPRATPGTTIQVHLDGLPDPLPATIRSVSNQAEFTPPVIFSRESRQKLVFRVKATFDGLPNPALRPGQPVDVRWPDAP
jgi:HlyD family secretion protein